jgi:hypothetical protein
MFARGRKIMGSMLINAEDNLHNTLMTYLSGLARFPNHAHCFIKVVFISAPFFRQDHPL